MTAAPELSSDQVTHFDSERKNTAEMIRLLEVLLEPDAGQSMIASSWDAASWLAPKAPYRRVEQVNIPDYQAEHGTPLVELAPPPACSPSLDVIESVFNGGVAGDRPGQR